MGWFSAFKEEFNEGFKESYLLGQFARDFKNYTGKNGFKMYQYDRLSFIVRRDDQLLEKLWRFLRDDSMLSMHLGMYRIDNIALEKMFVTLMASGANVIVNKHFVPAAILTSSEALPILCESWNGNSFTKKSFLGEMDNEKIAAFAVNYVSQKMSR